MTSLSLPSARRRLVAMLWLSAALHAAFIGLTRLPPPLAASLPPELQVQLAQPAAPAPPAAALPESAPSPPRKLPPQKPAQSAPPPVAAAAAAAPSPPSVAEPARVAPMSVREAPGPQLNAPQLADTRYYSVKELDVPPSSVKKPDPVYPPQAEEQGVAGRVLVRLHLEADGSVSRAEVVSVTPGGAFGEMFRKATLDSLKAARFRPAQRNGQPVRAVVEIPVVFEPEN